jgi:hypothetical protein
MDCGCGGQDGRSGYRFARARPTLATQQLPNQHIEALLSGSVSLGDFVKVIIEGLHKVGLLKIGLILALFGAIGLAIPDAWLFEQKIELSNTVLFIPALLGLCVIAAWALAHGSTSRAIRSAWEKRRMRSEFKKLSNKARLLLFLQVRHNSEQISVVVDDLTVQELLTRQFLRLSPGHIGQTDNRASIRSEKWRWLTSDPQFVERKVQLDETQERELSAMLKQAEPGTNS